MPLEFQTGMLDITSIGKKNSQGDCGSGKRPFIRITMAGGCVGPRLGMLFDSARSDDEVFQAEGIQYVIGREFLLRFQPITLHDIIDSSGFNHWHPPRYEANLIFANRLTDAMPSLSRMVDEMTSR